MEEEYIQILPSLEFHPDMSHIVHAGDMLGPRFHQRQMQPEATAELQVALIQETRQQQIQIHVQSMSR